MILLSGGFDPLHVGHVRMIREAHGYGRVIVAVNSDAWLMRKKHYVFMPWDDRAEILSALKVEVTSVDDSDGTVCSALRRPGLMYFGNGGDRTTANPKEHEVCVRLGIKEVFGLGGGKVRSSSELVRNARVLHFTTKIGG